VAGGAVTPWTRTKLLAAVEAISTGPAMGRSHDEAFVKLAEALQALATDPHLQPPFRGTPAEEGSA